MADPTILSSAAASASYNMILQLLFRLLTFFLNAFVLRYISKDLLGVVNVRLTLLYSTVLFISREAFRRAFLNKSTVEGKWPQVINLLWCIVPIAGLCSAVLSYVWIYLLESPDPLLVPHYKWGVVAFAVSTVYEVISEPLYIVAQNFLFVKVKVCAEGISLLMKCLLIALLVSCFPHLGVISFCIAQVMFTTIYSAGIYLYFAYLVSTSKVPSDFPFQSLRDFFPTFTKPVFSWSLVNLVWTFFKQSFFKQILTEGERYVMTVFDVLSFADQGVYDVINNLGSLAARFIFLPIEDSSYLFFSQTLCRGLSANEQPQEQMKLATQVLSCVLKVVTLVGLIILVFGYAYSFLLLDLYGGTLLSSDTGPMLLRWYCVYVLLLAVNGITECFSFATMSEEDVNRYNKKMLLFSVIFLSSSWYLTTVLGSLGFLLANCVNMLSRILHSLHYIVTFYAGYKHYIPLVNILPARPVLVLFVISFGTTAYSEVIFCCAGGLILTLVHISIGAICLLILLAAIYKYEQDLIAFVIEQYRQQKSVKHKKI